MFSKHLFPGDGVHKTTIDDLHIYIYILYKILYKVIEMAYLKILRDLNLTDN